MHWKSFGISKEGVAYDFVYVQQYTERPLIVEDIKGSNYCIQPSRPKYVYPP